MTTDSEPAEALGVPRPQPFQVYPLVFGFFERLAARYEAGPCLSAAAAARPST